MIRKSINIDLYFLDYDEVVKWFNSEEARIKDESQKRYEKYHPEGYNPEKGYMTHIDDYTRSYKLYNGKKLFFYNTEKPFIGFNEVWIEDISENGTILITSHLSMSNVYISKEQLNKEYFLTDSLLWKGIEEKDR